MREAHGAAESKDPYRPEHVYRVKGPLRPG